MNPLKKSTRAGKIVLLVFVLLVSALSAQTVKRSTSYYWNNQDWVYSQQTLYKYTLSNKLDSVKRYSYWSSGSSIWRLWSYSTYLYSGGGSTETVTDYNWNSNSEEFYVDSKTVTTYTSGNKPLQVIYSSWDGNAIVTSYKAEYIYNQNTFLTQAKGYSWVNNAWKNDAIVTFSNDALGNSTGYIYQELNYVTNIWENLWKMTSTYSGTNVVSTTLEDWEGNAWVPGSLVTHTYSGVPAKLKTSLSKTYTYNAWENNYQDEYVYTPAYSMITTQYWQAASSSWTNNRRVVDEYTLQPTSLLENQFQGLSLYPSPATDFVTLEGMEEGTEIKVFDSQGKFIQNNKTSSRSFRLDISSLPAGVYFICSEGQAAKKFVKE